MKKTRREIVAIERAEAEAAAAEIQTEIRSTGTVDIAACMRDKVRLGALATLEENGSILRDGAPDAHWRQPYVIAADAGDREAFKAQRIARDQAAEGRKR